MYPGVKQTRHLGNQYLIKWKAHHLKETQWVKSSHLDHLPKMVKMFRLEREHEVEQNKTHKKKNLCQGLTPTKR
jgi:hypothetical protein